MGVDGRIYYLFNQDGVVLYQSLSLQKVRAYAMALRCKEAVPVRIEDYQGNEYTLGRYSTGHLFKQAERPESEGESMSWEEVKKAAAGPFVKFEGDETKRLYIGGEPMVIKARNTFGGGNEIEDVGVLPVLEDGKFKVLSLRSSRLREALLEKWEVIVGRMADVSRKGQNFETKYTVNLSKSKKKPDAKLISLCEKAFAEFIKENKKRIEEVPD